MTTKNDQLWTEIPRTEFRRVLTVIAKAFDGRPTGDAILTTRGDRLSLKTEACEYEIRTNGGSLGRVSVDAAMLLRLRTKLPKTDPLPIRVDGKSLCIGSVSIRMSPKRAASEPSEPIVYDCAPEIEPGTDPSLVVRVAYVLNTKPEKLADARNKARLDEAYEEYEDRVGKAREVLAPLGVSADSIRWLAYRSVLRAEKALR